jgi:hypothetical protein
MFVKEFAVPAGTTIFGAQFENNDASTIFPEVLLVRGPASGISGGTVVTSATNIRESALGNVTIAWSTPIVVSTDATYYLGVCPPAGSVRQGTGMGAGVGADNVEGPNGSYITWGSERLLLPIRADLAMSLVTNMDGFDGPSKAERVERATSPQEKVFLAVNVVEGGAAIEFGLKQSTRVTLRIYDVSGRLVRELIHGTFDANSNHKRMWDGRGVSGEPVSVGVYFVHLHTDAQVLTQKLVLAQ